MKVDLPSQSLRLIEAGHIAREFSISTARKGPGELMHSERTPRGWHMVRAKIGADCPFNTVFVARRPTGELYTPELGQRYPDRDWILTRILWLSGLEPGHNRLGLMDTMRRYIYVHGCPDDIPVGVAGSRGCIRMRNSDIVDLFDCVRVGTRVLVTDR